MAKKAGIASTIDLFRRATEGELGGDALSEAASLAARVMDWTLITGNFGAGFKRAVREALGERPASLDVPELAGSRDLVTAGGARDVYDLAPAVLWRAIVAGRAELLPWLVEGLLIAWPGEKRYVCEALMALEVPPSMRDGAADRFARLVADAPLYTGILESLIELPDPLWTLTFLECMSFRDEALGAIESAPFSVQRFQETGRAMTDDEITRVAALLDHPRPAIVYPAAQVLNGFRAGAVRAADALVRMFARAGGGELWTAALDAGLEALNLERVTLTAEQVAAIEPLKRRRGDDEPTSFRPFLENQTRPAMPRFSLATRGGRTGIATTALHWYACAMSPARVACAFVHARWATPERDWRTNEDAVGVAVIDPETGAVGMSELPVRFPLRPSGGAGAKRSIEDVAVADGKIFVSVVSPYSNESGWGDESYLVSYDPAGGAWSAWKPGDAAFTRVPLRGERRDEIDLPRACLGLLKFTRDGTRLGTQIDATAYAFEDAQTDIRPFRPVETPAGTLQLRAPDDESLPDLIWPEGDDGGAGAPG